LLTNKHVTPILFIIGLVLFNIYEYNRVDDSSVFSFFIASASIGLFKGLRANEFKDIFNLYRIKNLFKGSLRLFEVLVAILLIFSTTDYQSIMMSVPNFLFEIVSLFIFTFIYYRFLTFNLFKEEIHT